MANLLSEQQNFSHKVRVVTTSGKRGLSGKKSWNFVFEILPSGGVYG